MKNTFNGAASHHVRGVRRSCVTAAGPAAACGGSGRCEGGGRGGERQQQHQPSTAAPRAPCSPAFPVVSFCVVDVRRVGIAQRPLAAHRVQEWRRLHEHKRLDDLFR